MNRLAHPQLSRHQIIGVFVAAISFASPAYAYIDPGLSGLLLSMAFGWFALASGRIRSFFARFKKNSRPEQSMPESAHESSTNEVTTASKNPKQP